MLTARPTDPSFPALTDQLLALAAATVGLAMLVGLLFSRRPLIGTTLTSSWIWSLLAVGALAGCELLAAAGGVDTQRSGWLAPLRFTAFTGTFCPMMALFGARRPQNREWKYIVGCLWIVLALPAGRALLFRPGPFYLEPVWAFFLLSLIGAGSGNYLGTRYWPCSVLYASGQLLLIANYLPWLAGRLDHQGLAGRSPTWATGISLAGILCLAAALAAAHLIAFRRRLPSPRKKPLDRLWIDFRDTFGAVWALRVAQRTNAAAVMYNWNMVLHWDGFHPADPARPDLPRCADLETADTTRAVERNLRSLLRRFVSPEWIDQRLVERGGERCEVRAG